MLQAYGKTPKNCVCNMSIQTIILNVKQKVSVMWICMHVSVGMCAHTYTYMQNGYRKLAFIWNLCVNVTNPINRACFKNDSVFSEDGACPLLDF